MSEYLDIPTLYGSDVFGEKVKLIGVGLVVIGALTVFLV